MDLREIIRARQDDVAGHKPVTERLNVKAELRRFSVDPLSDCLQALGDEEATFFKNDIGRYAQAFSWYALCLGRTLEHCSVSRRWDKELRWHPVTVKYSARQAQLAHRAKSIWAYQELDYQNLLIHACILLNRVIALSRRFLCGRNLPSFTSFNQHKGFLKKNPIMLKPRFRDYAERVSNTTDWFDIPLRVLRDKYLMHSAERHLVFLGWPNNVGWDLVLITVISASGDQKKLLERVKLISFSPRRLARDMHDFLSWFAEYALAAVNECPTRG